MPYQEIKDITCPTCGEEFTVHAFHDDNRVTCPFCDSILEIHVTVVSGYNKPDPRHIC